MFELIGKFLIVTNDSIPEVQAVEIAKISEIYTHTKESKNPNTPTQYGLFIVMNNSNDYFLQLPVNNKEDTISALYELLKIIDTRIRLFNM